MELADLPPSPEQMKKVPKDPQPPPTTVQSLISLIFPCTTVPPEFSSHLQMAMMLMVAQQATGINVITFFTEPLCRKLVHVSHSARCAFSLGLAQLVFTLIASLLIDKFPRRLLVIAMGVLMATSMFFFAIGQKVSSNSFLPTPS